MKWKCIVVMLLAYSAAASTAHAQLTLDTCIQRAYRHFDFQRQIDVAAEITANNVSRIQKSYYPSLELNAQSTYQNTQITIPIAIPIPGYTPPSVPLNLNSALFTLRQFIYDGSMVHHASLIEEASGRVTQLEVESQRLEVRTQVMQRFFAVLLTDKQLENLQLRDNVLHERLSEVETAVANNIVLAAERDLLQAEVIRLQNAATETRYTRRDATNALGQLLGEKLPVDVQLQTPSAVLDASATVNERPDMRLLEGQIGLLEARKGTVSSLYLPKIGFFADLGVGYPGYNIFDPDPALMARVGIQFNWKIFDWDQGARQEQSIDLGKQQLGLQRERISTQARIMSETFLSNIDKVDELMKSDARMIELYSGVTKVYASQLTNGTITSAVYVEQLTKQEEARVNSELHTLQRLIAIMNYNTTLGR